MSEEPEDSEAIEQGEEVADTQTVVVIETIVEIGTEPVWRGGSGGEHKTRDGS